MRVIKTTETFELKVNEVTFKLRPLTKAQKKEVQSVVRMKSGVETSSALDMAEVALAYAVADVDGLEDDKGTWKPNIVSGKLDSDSIDVLLNLPFNRPLLDTAFKLVGEGVPTQLLDDSGNPYEGVEIALPLQEKKD